MAKQAADKLARQQRAEQRRALQEQLASLGEDDDGSTREASPPPRTPQPAAAQNGQGQATTTNDQGAMTTAEREQATTATNEPAATTTNEPAAAATAGENTAANNGTAAIHEEDDVRVVSLGAWARGPPILATPEMTALPDEVAEAMSAHCREPVGKWRAVPRLPKKVSEMVGAPLWCTRLKHEFVDLWAAEKFEENFRRQAMGRAASMIMVVFPGVGSWLFLWGITDVRRAGPVAGRGVVVTTVSAELPVPPGFAARVAAKTLETYVLQGPRGLLEKYASNVVFRARVGVDEGADMKTEWVEALGVPKPGWQDHLCGMPAVAVRGAHAYQARGATVQLPFGAFGVNARFAAAGGLAKAIGGNALVCGFDVRLLAPGGWTEDLRAKVLAHTFAGKKVAGRVFTDAPPTGTRDIGGTPALESVAAAATAVETEAPNDRGVVVVAARGSTEEVWKEVVAVLGVGARLLRHNLAMAAVAVPAGRAAQLVGKSVAGAFWIRAPAAVAG
jgi:hypothetical protein